MGDISKDFSRWEFACKCQCGFDAVDVELIEVLQKLRDYYSRKITITSGCRCLSYNRAKCKDSTDNSQHVKAKAADIIIFGIWPVTVYHTLDTFYPERYGLGLYDDFVHIDVRRIKARWGI
jgi:uncharacterized protein YcbK (DUF882 family)